MSKTPKFKKTGEGRYDIFVDDVKVGTIERRQTRYTLRGGSSLVTSWIAHSGEHRITATRRKQAAHYLLMKLGI